MKTQIRAYNIHTIPTNFDWSLVCVGMEYKGISGCHS